MATTNGQGSSRDCQASDVVLARWLPALSRSAILLGSLAFAGTDAVRGPDSAAIPREISIDRSSPAPGCLANLIDLSYAVAILPWVFVVLALVVSCLLARRFRQALLLLLSRNRSLKASIWY